ncbi:MAG: carboxypeptidase regulatory-like domain-containing protein [Pyrinomonadaceae bacterium]
MPAFESRFVINRFCWFMLALILCFTYALDTRAQGHTIRGKVRNSTGTNLPRVTVSLETGNGALINQTVTNNEGDFYFGGLGDTSFTVTISAPDYSPASERVEFVRSVTSNEPGETHTIEITLAPKAGARIGPARVVFVQNVSQEARDAFQRGERLSRENKLQESIAAWREAVRVSPEYFDAHFSLGSAMLKARNIPEAISEFELARRINPKDDRLYQMFGAAMMEQRKFAVAAAAFAEASRLNAEDPLYMLRRGIALIEHASTLNPADAQQSATRRQALDEAESSLKRAYQVSAGKLNAVHQQLARVYERRGERARAAVELEKYLKKSPTDPNAAALREAIKKLRSTQ